MMNTKETIKTIITAIVILTATVLVYCESGGFTALAVFLGFGYAFNNNRLLRDNILINKSDIISYKVTDQDGNEVDDL